jgi:hypothetical protein
MRSSHLLVHSLGFLALASALVAQQSIDFGAGYETPHLQLVRTITNALDGEFIIQRIERSCSCLGTVRLLNTNNIIPAHSSFPIGLDLNTVGKAGPQQHFLQFIGTSQGEAKALNVHVLGYVNPLFTVSTNISQPHTFAQFNHTEERYRIRTAGPEPVSLTSGIPQTACRLERENETNYTLIVQYATEKAGRFQYGFELARGNVTKRFLIPYSVTHPLCSAISIAPGIVDAEKEQEYSFTVYGHAPKEIKRFSFSNDDLTWRVSTSPVGRDSLVSVHYKARKPGKVSGHFQLEVPGEKHPLIQLGFSAFFCNWISSGSKLEELQQTKTEEMRL